LVSTALQSDVCIIEVTTADAVTLTISAGLPIGHQYRIKRTVSSANGISVACSGSETIEGTSSFTVQGSKVSAVLDTGEVVIEKVSSTAWAFVGGRVFGSNSNGNYIKFNDGAMECWSFDSALRTCSATYLSQQYTFPQSFISIPPLLIPQWQIYSGWGYAGADQTRTASSCWIFAGGTNGNNGYLGYYAIGRWK
jgi:hypothetical protein